MCAIKVALLESCNIGQVGWILVYMENLSKMAESYLVVKIKKQSCQNNLQRGRSYYLR